MSEQVLITKEKLNNVANKVLDITGETSGKTLDELNTTLTNVNNEITTQGDLIAQLQAAVDSLPEAGGGGGSLETCTVTLETNGPTVGGILVYYTNENQELATETFTFKSSITIKCLKNSIISTSNGGMRVNTSGSLEVLYRNALCLVLHVFGDGNVVIDQ